MDWTHKIRLRNLKALLSLGTTHNVSRTADTLNMTQPAVSKWIRELEDELGLPLFDRHARGLAPTSYGKALIAHARRIDAHLDAAREEMDALRDGSTGRVVIGSAGSSGRDTVPLAVVKLIDRHPATSVRLVESPIAVLLEKLKSGEIDILVGRSDLQEIQAGIRYEVLYSEAVCVIASPQHPLAGREHLTWEDVLGYPWLVWPREISIQQLLQEALLAGGHQLPKRRIESDSMTLNLSILAHSDFIGTASQRAAEFYARLGVMQILPLPGLGTSFVAMYWREDLIERKAVNIALQCLRDVTESERRPRVE